MTDAEGPKAGGVDAGGRRQANDGLDVTLGGDRYAAARAHLRQADPVLARLMDEHPDFDPRQWLEQMLPKMDAFGALVFQVVGQQLSVRSARAMTPTNGIH